jgi:hypothetical protein
VLIRKAAMQRTTVALAIAMLAAAARVYACECATPYPKSAFKGSTAVFVGEVVSASSGVVVYRVIDRFKGSGGELVHVDGQPSMCVYSGTTVGSRHLIWAYGDPAHLATGMCTRSRPEREAQEDLRLLRQRAWWWRNPVSSLTLIRWFRQWRYDRARRQ